MNSAWVSSRKGFLEECLTLKIASFNFKFSKDLCVLMAEKALARDLGDVSVGKVSMMELGALDLRE